MPKPFSGKCINLRTRLLTLPCLVLVHSGTCAQGSVTGALVMSLPEVIETPAGTFTQPSTTFAVWPAPYGITMLSRAVLAVPWRPILALDGVATSAWVDLSLKGAEHWRVSSAYRLGAAASVRWVQPRGFPSIVETRLTVHASADLDSVWTLGVGVDDLLMWSTVGRIPERRLRIGAAWKSSVTVAIDVNVSPTTTSGILLGTRFNPADDITLRAMVITEPLTLSIATRCSLYADVPFVVSVDYVQHVGVRTGLAVEFP